ncbi:MAG TPA: hypothetical protein VH333_16770 [Pseudonocardiaceae bacterium]|jgi:hypothetical protein|nr:hypothetical protein [Pseudonocardiaceae bacterium]
MADGYDVSPDLLREASSGINETLAELKTLGITEAADEGRGFGSLALTGMQLGNEDLTTAFGSFTDKWSWGVRTMVKEGDQIAQLLGLTAGTYHDAEQYAIGVLKDAVNAVAGDPHAGEQVENQAFGQILGANKPDYSAASWNKTAQNASTTWAGVGRDVAEGPMGVYKTVADQTGFGQQFSAAEDQVFGPGSNTK